MCFSVPLVVLTAVGCLPQRLGRCQWACHQPKCPELQVCICCIKNQAQSESASMRPCWFSPAGSTGSCTAAARSDGSRSDLLFDHTYESLLQSAPELPAVNCADCDVLTPAVSEHGTMGTVHPHVTPRCSCARAVQGPAQRHAHTQGELHDGRQPRGRSSRVPRRGWRTRSVMARAATAQNHVSQTHQSLARSCSATTV